MWFSKIIFGQEHKTVAMRCKGDIDLLIMFFFFFFFSSSRPRCTVKQSAETFHWSVTFFIVFGQGKCTKRPLYLLHMSTAGTYVIVNLTRLVSSVIGICTYTRWLLYDYSRFSVTVL